MVIKVTKLEKLVLETLASEMYAELGFSDCSFQDLCNKTKLDRKVLRGVVGSLIQKGFMFMDGIIVHLNNEAQTIPTIWREHYRVEAGDDNVYQFVTE